MALSEIKTNIQKWETKGEPQANGSYEVRPMTAWLSSTGISHHDLLPHIPLICLSADSSSPPQSLNSSSQLLCLPGDQHQGMYVCSKDWLILFHLGCHRSEVPLSALNVSPLTQTTAPMCGDRIPASVFQPTKGRSSPTNTLVSITPPPTQFLHPTEFSVVLYILFHRSGTPIHPQLVSCMHFCVWRCIPDVSMERDVLHLHLLLCHLVLLFFSFVLSSFTGLLGGWAQRPPSWYFRPKCVLQNGAILWYRLYQMSLNNVNWLKLQKVLVCYITREYRC